MKKKHLLKPLRVCLCALQISSFSAFAAETKPNIVLIIADDLGYADMSFLSFSPKDIKTPGIDSIAREGVYFSNAYATSPICSPSRAGLATGRYQQRWGNYWFGKGGLPVSEVTIAMELKKRGYGCKKIGKNHMNGQKGDNEHPLKHGYDEFFGFNDHTWDYRQLDFASKHKAAHRGPLEDDGKLVEFKGKYTTELFTKKAIEYIRRDHKGKPFFLHLSYNAVHHPVYVGNPKYEKKFGIKPFPQWDPSKGTYRAWHQKWGKGEGHDPDLRKRYLATLDCMDHEIGRLIQSLKRKGIYKNTVLIFISDNGGSPYILANNGPYKGNKYCEAEGGVRVPFIFSWPTKIKGNQSSSSLISTMDIYPTLVKIAGGTPHKNLDGKSLLPLLKGEQKTDNHEFLVFSRGSKTKNYAIRQGKWKLRNSSEGRVFTTGTQYAYDDQKGDYLYDLEKDPGEKVNLIRSHPEVASELKKKYLHWCDTVLKKGRKPKQRK